MNHLLIMTGYNPLAYPAMARKANMSGSGALDDIFLNTLKYFFKVDNPYITAKYQAKISFGIRITA